MYKGKTIAVVVPAYNVDRQIEGVVKAVPDFVDSIIVVNDCSKDCTSQVLASISDRRLTRVDHPRNTGVGGAMKTGFRIALEYRADIVVRIDGDGQMDPGLIPQFIEPLIQFNVDCTKGNRLLKKRNRQHMPLIRLWGNLVLSFYNKMASGYWHIFDPQNGYMAILGPTLAELDLDRIDHSYFFENSLLIELSCLDALVMDIPMRSVYGNERSNMSIQRILLEFPLKLTFGFWSRIWRRHLSQDLTPVGMFMLLGTPVFSFGLAFSLYHWIRSLFTGTFASSGTVMIGGLSIILGFQLLLQALLLDVSWSRRLSLTENAVIRNWIYKLQNGSGAALTLDSTTFEKDLKDGVISKIL